MSEAQQRKASPMQPERSSEVPCAATGTEMRKRLVKTVAGRTDDVKGIVAHLLRKSIGRSLWEQALEVQPGQARFSRCCGVFASLHDTHDTNDAMARGPIRDSRSEAEKDFKAMTTTPVELPPAAPFVPGVREQVTLRIDRDVLDYFQADGQGWQERINQALPKAAGK